MTGVRDALLPWQLIRVVGPSMLPTLRPGDRLLVRHGARTRPGDVVLARLPDLPDRLVVKRAVRPLDGGWWLVSDNAAVGSDSRTHGAGEALARAVLVLPVDSRLPRRVRRSHGPGAPGAAAS